MQQQPQDVQMGIPYVNPQQQSLVDHNGQPIQYAPPQQQNGVQIVVALPLNGFHQQQPPQPLQPQLYYPSVDPNFYLNNQFSNGPYAQPGIGYQPVYQPIPMAAPESQAIYPQNNDDAPPGPSPVPGVDYSQPNQQHDSANKYKCEPDHHPWGRSFKEGMDEEKTKKCGAIVFLIFILVNLAVIISLMIYHFGNKDVTLTSMAGALAYIGFNLQAHPILDVIVKDDGTSCPSGYQSTLLGTWPGTNPGCYCPGSGLKRGKCDKSGDRPKDWACDDVPARSAIDMYYWGGSKWCVLTAKPETEYTKTVDCGSGFRECSPGICVLSTLSCPVTQVKIDSTGTYKLAVGTNRYVVPETTTGESPLIALSVSPNDIPCFDEDRFASGPVGPYMLLKSNEKGCSKYGLDDQYSFELDDQKQEDLFDQNDFPSKVMNLPEYDDVYERTDSVLSYRRRMDVAESDFCLSIDTTLIDESGEAADKLNKYMTGTSIAAIIVHGLFLLALCVLPCVKSCAGKSFNDMMEGSASRIWLFPVAVLGLLEEIVLIVMLASAGKYRGVMVKSKDYFVELADMDCFTSGQSQDVVADYQVAVDDVAGNLYKYSLALFLLCTFLCVLPSLFLLIKFKKS